jgi:hypothetical protein
MLGSNSKSIVTLFCVVLTLSVTACRRPPEIIEVASVSSPNGVWIASARTEIFGAGLGTDYPLDIVRLAQGTEKSTVLVSAESNGNNKFIDAISWTSDHEITIRISKETKLVTRVAEDEIPGIKVSIRLE